MEAAGVELSSVLTARKVLILGTATTARKAPLPDPLYVYCTKMLSLSQPHIATTVSHRFAGLDRENTQLPSIPQAPDLPLVVAGPDCFRIADNPLGTPLASQKAIYRARGLIGDLKGD